MRCANRAQNAKHLLFELVIDADSTDLLAGLYRHAPSNGRTRYIRRGIKTETSKVHIQILGLDRPVARKGPFHAATDRRPNTGVCFTTGKFKPKYGIEIVEASADSGDGQASRRIKENAIPHVAKSSSDRRKPIQTFPNRLVMGIPPGARRRSKRNEVIRGETFLPKSRPVEIAFDPDQPILSYLQVASCLRTAIECRTVRLMCVSVDRAVCSGD